MDQTIYKGGFASEVNASSTTIEADDDETKNLKVTKIEKLETPTGEEEEEETTHAIKNQSERAGEETFFSEEFTPPARADVHVWLEQGNKQTDKRTGRLTDCSLQYHSTKHINH